MKKLLAVFAAAVLAITFSAFTQTKSTNTEYHFQDATGWHSIDASEGCPNDGDVPCEIDNPETETVGDMVQLYTQENASPLYEVKFDDDVK